MEEWRITAITAPSQDSFVYELRPKRAASTTRQVPNVGHLWHLSLQPVNGDVSREYTPVSSLEEYMCGTLRILIKIYPEGELTGGYLQHLKVGDSLLVSRPEATLSDDLVPFTIPGLQLGCIAGGTGITPVAQAANAVLPHGTAVSMLYSSRTPNDILMRSELQLLEKQYQNFTGTHTLTQANSAPLDWDGQLGRIDAAMVRRTMPPPSEATRVLVCGPQGMLETAGAILRELGYTEEMVLELDA
jgi:cytochrome-b5 reductase